MASVRLHRVPEVPLQRSAAPLDDAKRNPGRVHRGTHADPGLAVLQFAGTEIALSVNIVLPHSTQICVEEVGPCAQGFDESTVCFW